MTDSQFSNADPWGLPVEDDVSVDDLIPTPSESGEDAPTSDTADVGEPSDPDAPDEVADEAGQGVQDELGDTPLIAELADTPLMDELGDTPLIDELVDELGDTPLIAELTDTAAGDNLADTPLIAELTDAFPAAEDPPAGDAPDDIDANLDEDLGSAVSELEASLSAGLETTEPAPAPPIELDQSDDADGSLGEQTHHEIAPDGLDALADELAMDAPSSPQNLEELSNKVSAWNTGSAGLDALQPTDEPESDDLGDTPLIAELEDTPLLDELAASQGDGAAVDQSGDLSPDADPGAPDAATPSEFTLSKMLAAAETAFGDESTEATSELDELPEELPSWAVDDAPIFAVGEATLADDGEEAIEPAVSGDIEDLDIEITPIDAGADPFATAVEDEPVDELDGEDLDSLADELAAGLEIPDVETIDDIETADEVTIDQDAIDQDDEIAEALGVESPTETDDQSDPASPLDSLASDLAASSGAAGFGSLLGSSDDTASEAGSAFALGEADETTDDLADDFEPPARPRGALAAAAAFFRKSDDSADDDASAESPVDHTPESSDEEEPSIELGSWVDDLATPTDGDDDIETDAAELVEDLNSGIAAFDASADPAEVADPEVVPLVEEPNDLSGDSIELLTQAFAPDVEDADTDAMDDASADTELELDAEEPFETVNEVDSPLDSDMAAIEVDEDTADTVEWGIADAELEDAEPADSEDADIAVEDMELQDPTISDSIDPEGEATTTDDPWASPADSDESASGLDAAVGSHPVPSVYAELEDLPPALPLADEVSPGDASPPEPATERAPEIADIAAASSDQDSWGSRWAESAQGWVEDEQGGSEWRTIVTTADTLSAWDVDTYLGMVSADTVLGAGSVEASLPAARTAALELMVADALTRGAHAVVAVSVTIASVGSQTIVTASGTAATLRTGE